MLQIRNDFARCVIRHPDGRWLYYVPQAASVRAYGVTDVLADGQAMTQICADSPWWAAAAEATRLTLLTRQRPKATGYKLRDTDALSVRYPAELTPEEWDDRRANSSDAEDETLWRLYAVVTEAQDSTESHIDGPFVVLDGTEPPAPGGPDWIVNLVDAITQRPEYRHLFPGHLVGLRTHIVAAIKRLPRVEHCFDGFQGDPNVYVSLRAPYAEPVTKWVASIGRSGKPLKSGRNREVTVSRALSLPVPTAVAGVNYAAALAEWDRQVEFWTAQVTDANVAACNHCHGTGHIPTGAEQYTVR